MLERVGELDAMKQFIAEFKYPIIVTRGATVVAVNDSWLSIFGYEPDAVVGRTYFHFMPPEERTRMMERTALRARAGGTMSFAAMTSLALKADGRATVVHVQPTVVKAVDGEPFVVNFLFVVPERDEEIELAELLVATSTCLASARTILEVREFAVTRLGEGGYSAAFFRRNGTAIYPPDATLPARSDQGALEEAVREERAVFVGADTSLPEGVIVPIQRGVEPELLVMTGARIGTPLRAALDLFAQGVGSALETATLIVDLERRNRELSDTRAELVRHERLAALGEMAASVAHEVRNPVGVISNAVSTLRRRLEGAGDSGELLSIIDEECLRLARMVRDLLEFANPRPVTLTLEVLSEIAEEAIAVASSQPDCAALRTTFRLELERNVPKISVDGDLLRQALVNLLINAAQASPEQGVVLVRVAAEHAEAVGPLASVSVVDRGCGIPDSVVGRIFDPFFTTRAQGSGLGLAVVRRVVDTLGAEILVDSQPGRGTSFRLAFRA